MVEKLFKSVGLVARYDRKQALTLVDELVNYLSSKNLQVLVEETLKGKVRSRAKMVPLKEMNTDFIITIGGDGTILRACLALPKPEPPIFGINMGVRGFLTEVEPESAFCAIIASRVIQNESDISDNPDYCKSPCPLCPPW